MSLSRFFKGKSEFDKKIKSIVGYTPNDAFLFKKALVHKSVVHDQKFEETESNERLELLGDAVLGLLIAEYLYLGFPDKNEGELTRLRALLVSRNNLNKIAVKIGLEDILVANIGGHKHSMSVYGNAFEALVGAIYLDGGIKRVKKFIFDHVFVHVIDIDAVLKIDPNYKSKVIEWAQAAKLDFEFITDEVFDEQNKSTKEYLAKLMVDGKQVSEASDFSKKKAEQKAAEIYYNQLNPI